MSDWRNRIVGTGMEGPEELKAHPNNWRLHTEDQREALESMLKEVGWVREVLVNKTTGNIIDGHLRVESAIADGQTEVPVTYLEVSEEEEQLILATLDPMAAMAGTSREKLSALMSKLTVPSEALRKRLELMSLHAKAGAQAPDTVPDLRETSIERGDIYQLGAHRLMCGDSTASEDVSALLDGATPFLCVTDPPYGVNYEGGSNKKKRQRLTGDRTTDLYVAALRLEVRVMYLWHAGRLAGAVYQYAAQQEWEVRSQIVWNKLKPHYGSLGADYKQRHEPCLYLVKGGASEFVGPSNEATVWDIEQPRVNEHHPTQKPVECMRRPLQNHLGDVVDPFVGSGTTLIAAQQIGRRCFAMELEPEYCQVAIDRWEAFTKDKAVKL